MSAQQEESHPRREPAEPSTASEGPSRTRRVQRSRSQADIGIWQRDYGQPVRGLNPSGGPRLTDVARWDWRTRGICADDSTGLWFSEPGTLKAQRAARICLTCPVRRLCLTASLVFDEEYGVWGGLPAAARRHLVTRLEAGEPLGAVLASVEPRVRSQAA